MHIGIGIDTGGTYTDAVLYDFELQKVVAKNKSLTTKENLSLGIKSAIDALPRDLLLQAEILSVSTTLATNACVENKGGRAKLLMVGTNKETLEWLDAKNTYGLNNDSVYCVQQEYDSENECQKEIHWDEVLTQAHSWFSDAQSIAVVAKDAVYNGAVVEVSAKESIQKKYTIPLVMANEVANNINMLERGATAVLNARLLSIVEEFVFAIDSALQDYDLNLKKMIVRSDGSLMADSLILKYPVKTILSGPAASVIGAMALADCKDSLIIDMGGTTTDISIVENGKPAMTQGIAIGGYRTQIQGVLIDTFPLGGDTRIYVDEGKLALDNRRVMPLSALSKKYPQVKEDLRRIIANERLYGIVYHEFLYLVKYPKNMQHYNEKEIAIIESLKDGPVNFSSELRDLYNVSAHRLETEGVIMRSGLTPTDFMHIKGDFLRYDKEASELGAEYLLKIISKNRHEKESIVKLANDVYNLVCKTLYTNIIKTLAVYKNPVLFKKGFDSQFLSLIEKCWDKRNETGIFSAHFTVNASLVGIGAPTHIFLDEVAKVCGSVCVIPEHAEVANALGAIIADISAQSKAQISPFIRGGVIESYTVYCELGAQSFPTRDDAIEYAKNTCKTLAVQDAQNRGALGTLSIDYICNENNAVSNNGETIELGIDLIVTATGRV